MKYEDLIRLMEKYQTVRVKSIYFQNSCATQRIPWSFSALIPNIIEIINSHIDLLCKENEIVAIFGLQPGPPALESDWPGLFNRTFDEKYPHDHFCLVLQYLMTTKANLPTLTTWSGSQNLMIDFTTGELMDEERYLAMLGHDYPIKGQLYGVLDHSDLIQAWSSFNKKSSAKTASQYVHLSSDVNNKICL